MNPIITTTRDEFEYKEINQELANTMYERLYQYTNQINMLEVQLQLSKQARNLLLDYINQLPKELILHRHIH